MSAVDRTRTSLPGHRALAVGLACVLFSCAARTSGDTLAPGGRPVAQADFAGRAASAVCDNIQPCCANQGYTLDQAGCTAFVTKELDWGDPKPNTIWDSAVAARCIDAFATITKACDAEAADVSTSCQHLFRGTLPEGASCVDDVECADIEGRTATCEHDAQTANGHCAPSSVNVPIRGTLGDACDASCSGTTCVEPSSGAGTSGTGTTCYLEDGLVCDFSTGRCAPPPALGEPCPGYLCAPGAYCDVLDGQLCVPTFADGLACHTDDQCDGGSCTGGLCGHATIASAALCLGTP